MPELLQEDFTPGAVAEELERWLCNSTARSAAVDRLDKAMRLLVSDGDAIGNAVREIRRTMEKGAGGR